MFKLALFERVGHQAVLKRGDQLEVYQSNILGKGEVERVEKGKEGRNLVFLKFVGQGWVWVCEQIESKIFVDPPRSTCGGVHSGQLFAIRRCDSSFWGAEPML